MPTFQANEVLRDRFTLVRELGEGGYGTVWLASDAKLQRQVAIKRLKRRGIVLPDDSANDRQSREELLQEALKISRLNHPHIIQIHDIIEDGGEALIVMEFAAGGSLHALLKERARHQKWVETREAVDLIRGILAGLKEAHGQEGGSIIHRDLKPANIMLAELRPKLADFGLAAVGPVDRMPTRAGERPGHLGTLYFMSPEQMRGEKLDHRSDLFNVGLIAFLLFGQRHPFSDEALLFHYRELVFEEVRPIPTLAVRPLIVDSFRDWIACLLQLRPEDRYRSADDALQEFEDRERSWSERLLTAALELEGQIRKQGSSLDEAPGTDPVRIDLAAAAPEASKQVREDLDGFTPGDAAEAISLCRQWILRSRGPPL